MNVDFHAALLEMEKMEKVYKSFSDTKKAIIAITSMQQANKEIIINNEKLKEENSILSKQLTSLREKCSNVNEELQYKLKQSEGEFERITQERHTLMEESLHNENETLDTAKRKVQEAINELLIRQSDMEHDISKKDAYLAELNTSIKAAKTTVNELVGRYAS